MDKKSGLVVPARSDEQSRSIVAGSSKCGTVEQEYNRTMDISEMLREEKSSSSKDQLEMFSRAAKVCVHSIISDTQLHFRYALRTKLMMIGCWTIIY